MGFFKKLSSVLGTDLKQQTPSAFDSLKAFKREFGMNKDREEKDEDEGLDDDSNLNEVEEDDKDRQFKDVLGGIEESLRRAEDEEDEEDRQFKDVLEGIEESLRRAEDEYESDDEEEEEEDFDDLDDEEEDDDEEEYEEEDEELVENRAKPVFVVRLKRFEYPLTTASVREHSDEFASCDVHCVLMRDMVDEAEQANCFFDALVDKLLNKAVATLEEWNEDEETEVEPVVDIVTEIKCYNDDIDNETLKNVCYFIVNAYGEQAMDVKGRFPYKDSLIRIIIDEEGCETVKDALAYPILVSLEDDDEGWVERMISEHGIKL